MAKYIIRRVLIALIVLFGITVIDFLIMSLLGNPIEILSGGPKVSDAMLARRAESMGLDQPVIVQYLNWLKAVMHGDFGYSYTDYQPVSNQIVSHLGPTLILTVSALVLSLIIAVAGGIYSAVHVHSKGDYVIVTLSFIGQSVPGFFLALLLIYIFAVRLGWVPASGMRELGTDTEGVSVAHLILPCVTLAVSMAGRNIRYIRSAMLEILNRDYLRAAEARGIGKRRVIWKHALRNALIPIVTVLAPLTVELMTGSLVVEQIFAIPGIGSLLVSAIQFNDYNVVLAVVFVYSVMFIAVMLAVDILYGVIDPRIRLAKEDG